MIQDHTGELVEVGDLVRVSGRYCKESPLGIVLHVESGFYARRFVGSPPQLQDRIHIMWSNGTLGTEPSSYVECANYLAKGES